MLAGVSRPFADAAVPARTAAALSVVTLAGAALLVAGLRRSRRTAAAGSGSVPIARDAYGYLLLALATRFTIQQHRSRAQILVLLMVVAAVEAARWRSGTARRRSATWLAGSAAVCLGVVMAKWALEPGALSETLDRLRDGATE